MSLFQKLFQTVLFLLAIPFFKFAFSYMLKKMEVFFKEENTKALKFFYGYQKIITFFISKILPVIIIIVIISIWINESK